MSKTKSFIRQIIEEEIRIHLLEQEDTSVDSSNPAPSGEGPDAGGDDGAGDLDPGDSVGGVDGDALDLGNAGGDIGDIGDPGEGDDLGGDLGDIPGGGGHGGGGGGFNFGDEGDSGMEPDEEGEEDLANTVGPEDVEFPTDPIASITDEAIQMLNQTREVAPILKNIKSSIQKYFDDFDDATPIIKSLWDTEDIVLRDVARRLLLFIKGI